METCVQSENPDTHKNVVDIVTNTCTNDKQENNLSSVNSSLHETTLYDVLPVSDTMLVETLTQNFTDRTSMKEAKKENNCASEQKDSNAADGKKSSNALLQLVDYGLSDTEDSNSDSDESLSDSEANSENDENSSTKPNVGEENTIINNTEFRENESSSDSSSTSEYETDSSSSYSDIGACGVTPVTEKKKFTEKMAPPRTKGELSLKELPPIEELKITVSEEECIEIGVVSSIIDQLVIVQSLKGTPAYDIDTLFFLNRGKNPLGRVFDVLGPVTEPLYAIRFNSYEQAIETGAKPGTPVYCAPRTQHTSYVFVSELMKVRLDQCCQNLGNLCL